MQCKPALLSAQQAGSKANRSCRATPLSSVRVTRVEQFGCARVELRVAPFAHEQHATRVGQDVHLRAARGGPASPGERSVIGSRTSAVNRGPSGPAGWTCLSPVPGVGQASPMIVAVVASVICTVGDVLFILAQIRIARHGSFERDAEDAARVLRT